MTKLLLNLLLSASVLVSTSVVASPLQDLDENCNNSGDTVLAFFNGVNNTVQDADINLWEINRHIGNTTQNGSNIQYEKLYNYTNGFEDFVETFEQRLKEQQALAGRYELFFPILTGQGTFLNRITSQVRELLGWANQFTQVLEAKAIRDLTTLLADPPTQENYQEHRNTIDGWIAKTQKILFVPHSQGNLFANNAYHYSLKSITADNIKIVHVAPASPIVNGPHILANQDLVINGLRLVGSVPANTHAISVYNIFGNNHGRDMLGHSFTETYLNPAFPMLEIFKQQVNESLNTLVSPRVELVSKFIQLYDLNQNMVGKNTNSLFIKECVIN